MDKRKIKYSPRRKMAEFDAMPKWARGLANEYGMKAVKEFMQDGPDECSELLAMWRGNRQADLIKDRRHRA